MSRIKVVTRNKMNSLNMRRMDQMMKKMNNRDNN